MRRPLCLIVLLFLTVYLAIALPLQKKEQRQVPDGETVILSGTAASLYESVDQSQMSFTLESVEFSANNQNEQQNSRVICYLPAGQGRLPKLGSHVVVYGTAEAFREASNPGEFDMRAYYERQGYLFCLKKTEILQESAEYDRAGQFLYELAHRTSVYFWEVLGEKNGSLSSAMVLGIKKGLEPEVKNLYQEAGIGHLLAISGLHMSLIGMGIFQAMKSTGLPLGISAAASGVLLAVYGAMTGMGVSTVRALIMFFLLLFAKLLGRTSDVPTSMALAAAAILIPNPALVKDAGFQLSFSAVFGAVAVVPVLQEMGLKSASEEKRRWGSLLEKLFSGLISSFGITLTMLPFLLLHYYKWNPWSFGANLIVIPLMSLLLPMLLVLAGFGVLNGYEVTLGARILALPVKGIFFVYEKICEIVLTLPGSSVITGAPKGWQIGIFCAGLGLLVWRGRKCRPLFRNLLAFGLTFIFLFRVPKEELAITMLDVGQGECVCVETPEQEVWLLDAGSTSKTKTGQYQIIPFLEYSGVRRIDGIFISHWDEDHVSALEELLPWAKQSHVRIERLVLPDTQLEDEALLSLKELAADHEIALYRAGAGDVLKSGGTAFYCLHPYEGETAADRNQVSLVWKLEYGDFSALFTGDLQTEGEQWLVEQYGDRMLDCDLLDAGHHGAANASSQAFLEATSPAAVLISCGKNNRYGHPSADTLERIGRQGAAVYVTADSGALLVRVRKGKMRVTGFKG